ncbi:hypothetical protein IP88_07685 [alpha proteobacterium AAP81b]|nr:hypothetical protein IP88_07685 [alpha proteobacterium AAP81b]
MGLIAAALVVVLLVLVLTLFAFVGLFAFLVANIAFVGLALLGGLAIAALFGGGVATTAIATLALIMLLVSGRRQRRLTRRRGYDLDLAAEPARREPDPLPARRATGRRARAEATTPQTPLDAAWSAAAREADWARSRLAVAQESCRLFLGAADRVPLDSDAGDLALRIRKRIPEHVAECLDKCEVATASERRAILEELVRTLEKVGASADRERERLMGPATDMMTIQRRHLTRDSAAGPIALD